MEYGMSPELAEFRAEVRAFIAEYAPAIPPRAGVRSAENDAELKALQEWTGRLYEVGYLGWRIHTVSATSDDCGGCCAEWCSGSKGR
jgi:hypothetical protein